MAEEKKWICGFWRRIGAFLLDSVVLGLVGIGMGFFLEDFFIENPARGLLIGFSIASIYFGIMNSELAIGQTLGKKALEIRVVDCNNKPIGFVKSIGRYGIIAIPFFMNGAQFSTEAVSAIWLEVFRFVCLCVYISAMYLYVFNRNTRQSLHDLIFDTYVVNAEVEKIGAGVIWRPHLAVVSLIFIMAVSASVFAIYISSREAVADISRSPPPLMNNSVVQFATVSFGNHIVSTLGAGTSEVTFASAEIFLKDNQVSNALLARELAESLAKTYPQARKKEIILINLIYGYDIGIASKWYRHSHRINVNELSRDKAEQANENVKLGSLDVYVEVL